MSYAFILRSSHQGKYYKGRIQDSRKNGYKDVTSERRYFSPMYQSFFYGYCFTCNNFGHRAIDYKACGRKVQARNGGVHMNYNAECYNYHNYEHMERDCRSAMNHNVEWYKWKNYGHKAHDCIIMIKSSIKENTSITYKKVWKKKSES